MEKAKKLFASVQKYSSKEGSCSAEGAARARKRIATALTLKRIIISTLAGYKENIIKYCQTEFCEKTDRTSLVKKLHRSVKYLLTLSQEAQHGALKTCQTGGGWKNHIAQRTHSAAQKWISKLPNKSCAN
jgi:hypothetical protein